MTISWNRSPGEAWSMMVKTESDLIEDEVVTLVDGLTDQAAAWMKENHRWQNVTGAAEAGLYADTIHVARQTVSMLLSHDPTLEYAHELERNPRFALLGDAVDWFAPLLFRGLQEIARRHSGR
jgi:hypothetical protein